MDVCILASSSSGNSTALRINGDLLLIDAGLSGSQIEKRLRDVGWSPADLRGIMLSHEHIDHVRGVGVLARRYGVPVYATAGTLEAASSLWKGTERLRPISVGQPFSVGDAECEPFAVPHDVADPVQFVVRTRQMSFGIATDLGKVTTLVTQKLSGVDLAVIEANHDIQRLRWGDYPWAVKQRIAGPHGHLSNEQAGRLAADLARAGVRHIVLAHLSPNHNDKEQALDAVSEVLATEQMEPKLRAVGPREPPVMIHVDGTDRIEA